MYLLVISYDSSSTHLTFSFSPRLEPETKEAGNGRGLFSFFKTLTAGRTITKDSLLPIMEKMKEHLISGWGYENGCG